MLYPDIFNFLSFNPSELKSKDLNDYKTSKGYSYYATGWLRPLFYHPVSETSKYCLLKTTCRPSQKISDVPHKLWICLCKGSGKIMTAHCSCMAGLSQVCNHIAAALFRIEAAIRMGLNNPSSTSKSCEWLPNNKKVVPVRLQDLKLGRADFGSRRAKKSELNCSPKKRFNPCRKDTSLNLADICSAFHSAGLGKDDSMIFMAEESQREINPAEASSVSDEICTLDDFLLISSSSEEYFMQMEYFPSNKSIIEANTRGQHENQLWFSIRKHVITASIAHEVKTRMQTNSKYEKEGAGDIDMNRIFDLVAGNGRINSELPALKYGRAMESEAVTTFLAEFKKHHKKVNARECGIFICGGMPFVGGSPDRIITCSCCRTSCLEVKTPYSIRDKSPVDSEVKLPYLKQNRGELRLNENHKYFTQCQVQMAATEISASYFYVWTPKGSFTQEIKFDEKLWEELKTIFYQFYANFYVPSLFQLDERTKI